MPGVVPELHCEEYAMNFIRVCVAKIKVQKDYCRSSQLFLMGFFKSGSACSELLLAIVKVIV